MWEALRKLRILFVKNGHRRGNVMLKPCLFVRAVAVATRSCATAILSGDKAARQNRAIKSQV